MTTNVAAAMAEAASALLALLDNEQRAAATWPFPSDQERRLWFYTPTDHGGLPIAMMSPQQQRATHRLLATGLSTAGYVTAAAIMGLENVLDYTEGWTAGFERARGRDPLLYYVSLFGTPGDNPWGWRFGGHHISLHYTVVDGRVVAATPNFLGADPATSALLGPHLHRPLAGVEDLGLELMRSFDQEQHRRATISSIPPSDLVGSNRTVLTEGDRPMSLTDIWRRRFEGDLGRAMATTQSRADTDLGIEEPHLDALSFTHIPKGLISTKLTADQRELLWALLDCYLHRLPDELADEQKSKVAASFDFLHVAWAGGSERGQPHYYRLHGGDHFVEYDNTQRGANHIHSVWRDLSTDFGGDALAAHYAADHRS